jgi:hypothetical protein
MTCVVRADRVVVGTGVLLLGLVLAACGGGSRHAVRHGAVQRATVDAISIQVPRGWTLRRDPVPALVEPSLPFAVGSWPLPSGGNGCAPTRAISALPPTAALFWLYEYGPGARRQSDFPPQPRTFRLGRLGGPFECLGVRAYRITFRSHGRDFQVHVILGRRAARLRHDVIAALSSLRVLRRLRP